METQCEFRYWTEHGEPRVCRLAMRDHYDGSMDEPHQFRAQRRALWLFIAFVVAFALLMCRPAEAQISADLNLGPLIQQLRPRKAPKVTCGITTVGYRFVGPAGRKLRYAGDTYEIESDGNLELIADKRRKTYAIDGRSLPLDVWPMDQFGFREARLPDQR